MSEKCINQNKKKYFLRKSPPYPANKCKNKTKKGNDGKLYKSTLNRKNIYRWVIQ